MTSLDFKDEPEILRRNIQMSTEVGVWVDHRRALVVRYSAKETSSETILSNIEKSASTSGGSTSHAP